MNLEWCKKLVEEHWSTGKSLRRIERENGLSNDVIRKFAIKHNIPTRSRKESINASMKFNNVLKGEKHWSQLKPASFKQMCIERSIAMRKNNPVFCDKTLKKIAKTKSNTYKKHLTQHEKLITNIFHKAGICFDTQVPIDKYIADIVIDNTIVELDGRGHAGRAGKDAIRDQFLCSLGFNVVRVNQDSIFNTRARIPKLRLGKLCWVLEKYLPRVDFSSIPPSIRGKYRVLVREAYSFTEVIY